MQLFHASTLDFAVGEIIEATTPGTYYVDAVAEIEKFRPADAPSRASCVFASDNAGFVVFFLLRQQVKLANIRLYTVEMPNYWKSPFAITHALHRRIQKSQATFPLVSEYWDPQQAWKFYEFFGPCMIVKEKLIVPEIAEMFLGLQYSLDADQAINM